MRRIITFVIIILLLQISLLFSQRYGESDDFSYALKLFNEGFYDIAAQQFQLFANRYPNSDRLPDAKFYQALSLFNLNDLENARIEFQSLAVSFPDHKRAAEAWEKVGECYLKMNKPEDAARAFETIKVLYPNSSIAPEALLQAAKIYFSQKKYSKAELILQDFLDRYTESAVYPRGQLLYARVLMARQNFTNARKMLEKVLQSDAGQDILAEAHLGLSSFYEQLGQWEQAKEQCETVLQKFAKTPVVYPALQKFADLLAKTKQYDQAIQLINKNLDRLRERQQKADLQLKLAALHYLRGNYFAARQAAEAVKPTGLPDSLQARLYFYLATIYEKEDKPEQSIEYFEKILTAERLKLVAPQLAAASARSLGLLHLKQNQFRKGYDQLTTYLKDYPKAAERDQVYISLIRAALRNEKEQEAEQLYQRFLSEYPRHPQRDDLLFEFGKFYFARENYGESQRKFEQLVKNYYCSAKYDSARLYMEVIRDFYQVNQNVGVNKLAGLLGKILAQENPDRLKLELAKIQLYQLKNISSSLQLCRSVTEAATDSAFLGEAYYLEGENYRRLAELKRFQGEDNRTEKDHAREAFKKAMEYIAAVSNRDSLSFAFLTTNVDWESGVELPVDKKIKFWKHFVRQFPDSPFVGKARWKLSRLYLTAADTSRALAQLDSLLHSGDTELAGKAYFSSSKLLTEQGRLEEAIYRLKDFLLNIFEHPLRAKAFALLAGLNEKQGALSEAAQAWNRLRSEYNYAPLGENALVHIPEVYYRTGEYEKVLRFTAPYFSDAPMGDFLLSHLQSQAEPELYFYSGKAYFQLNELAKARKQLLNYLYTGDNPNHREEALLLLAEIAEKDGDESTALLHLKSIVKNQTSSFFIQASKKIADIFFKQKKYEEARTLYKKLVTRTNDPDQKMQFKVQEMICLIRQGKFKSFGNELSSFKKAYKKMPGFNQSLALFEFESGKYYYQAKNFDAAEKRFKKVTGKYKKTEYVDDAEYFLGLTYTTLNRVEKAQEVLTRFIEKYPSSPLLANIYITLGSLYYRGEKRELAVGAFKNAVEYARDPETRQVALSNLIGIYRDLGLWDGLLAQARTYVEEFPNAADAMDKKIMIGNALINLNRYSEAVDYLRKLKREATSEQEPEIQFYIGEAYFNAGQYENAVREFVKIPLLSKQTKLQWEASALYYSGQAYEKLGRIDDAIRMYQEIIDRPGILLELKREAKKQIEKLKKTG